LVLQSRRVTSLQHAAGLASWCLYPCSVCCDS
jgi:hypothetical protein